jgi:hypothetical protein
MRNLPFVVQWCAAIVADHVSDVNFGVHPCAMTRTQQGEAARWLGQCSGVAA